MSGQSKPLGLTIHVKRHIPVDGVLPKRRKLEHARSAPEEHQLSTVKHISVKREPSLTPPPSLAPRTSGTIHINIPPECLKTQHGWKEKRDKWVAEETSKLRQLGLTIPKRLIREDGLALDWVSAVPVCPLTLRPPSQGLSDEQVHQLERAPSKQPPMDMLGHALHDQLLSSRLSSTSVPKFTLDTQVEPLRQNVCESLPQNPEAPAMSDFTVVGAATRKEHGHTASDRAADTASNSTIQWEHRKLLPPDLRLGTQYRYASKEHARDRKARRLVWITKEVEKVEAYTGEKVGGFRYDGDDVIIYLNKAVYYARRRRERTTELPARPPQLDHRLPRISHAPPTGPRPIGTTIASRENSTQGPILSRSRTSVSLGSGRTAGGTSTVTAKYPITSSNLQVAKKPSSLSEGSTSMTCILDGTPSLNESTIRDSEAVTQARGLGFLERYLHLFDSDREALLLAYTPNATFCLTEEKYDNSAVVPGPLLQILKTGRSGIVETLKEIRPDRHHSPSADIAYNIATLDDMSMGGLLLTCEGTLIPVDQPIQNQRHQWYFSRIFVLKQSNESCRQSWPLQIAAERLTIQRKVN